MPKRSDRNYFKKAFEGNPFEDLNPEEMYSEIRWGNKPRRIIPIDAPEPLATIGECAQLITSKGTYKWPESAAPYLAVGKDTNILYVIPQPKNKWRIKIPDCDYLDLAYVKQTDYYSDKGGDECYYFHKHEKPFPRLFVHENGVAIIIPVRYRNKKSYAVSREGIIG
jgi:hypothetical protein